MNAPASSRVLMARVDWLTLAYRCELSPMFVAYLEGRAREAKKHGRAAVRWRSIVGEMGFSRAPKCWHVRTARYQLHIMVATDENADGSPCAGWTVELVWSAQALAQLGHTGPAVEEGERIAADIGNLIESRVRRLDLCADIAGWSVERGDVDRLVRRSRAKLDQHGALAPVSVDGQLRAKTRVHHNFSGVTGVTVCPGGAFMARLYDKREELAVKSPCSHDDEAPSDELAQRRALCRACAEKSRWRARGWDGTERVTRVEFQLKGDAIKELGLRNPKAPIDPSSGSIIAKALHDRLDAVWQKCLIWLKLVKLQRRRRSECPLDPVWLALKAVRFLRDAEPAARFRIRRHASPEQTLGCVLSTVGAMIGLERVEPAKAEKVQNPERELVACLGKLFEQGGALIARELSEKWKGPAKALEHVWTVQEARRAYDDSAGNWIESGELAAIPV